MQTQLEMWDGKIRRMDQKMKTLDDTASMLASTASEQKNDFTRITTELKDMFLIEGVIGEEETDAYADLS